MHAPFLHLAAQHTRMHASTGGQRCWREATLRRCCCLQPLGAPTMGSRWTRPPCFLLPGPSSQVSVCLCKDHAPDPHAPKAVALSLRSMSMQRCMCPGWFGAAALLNGLGREAQGGRVGPAALAALKVWAVGIPVRLGLLTLLMMLLRS